MYVPGNGFKQNNRKHKLTQAKKRNQKEQPLLPIEQHQQADGIRRPIHGRLSVRSA